MILNFIALSLASFRAIYLYSSISHFLLMLVFTLVNPVIKIIKIIYEISEFSIKLYTQ